MTCEDARMPTYDFRGTATPKDLVAELNLAPGQYSVQNIDQTAIFWVRESVNPPGVGELGIRLAPGDAWVMIVKSEPMWLWSFDVAGCRVVVNG